MADGYQVINQRQTIALLPDATYGPVMRVTFRTRLGVVTSIDVPASDYNADNVRALIEAHQEQVDAVQNL